MIREHKNYSLLPHNTFRLDVNAKYFIEYDTLDDLRRLISGGSIGTPFVHIGGGSNLLFIKDYEGTILHSAIKGIEKTDETEEYVYLRAGSGVNWDDFVAYCVENSLYGAENLTDIPGEVGASAVQNIGAYGVEAKDIITSVCTIDITGKEKVFSVDECGFSYRHSIFKTPEMKDVIVTHVVFRLSKKPQYMLDYGMIREELKKYPEISLRTVRDAIRNIRSSKLPDPKVLGNAGSFFMNPIVSKAKFEELKETYPTMPFYMVDENSVKIPAGWLIEQSGWKGKALGRAAVHNKQALVLVNTGGATSKDIIALSTAVQRAVYDKFGIEIRPEVKVVGEI